MKLEWKQEGRWHRSPPDDSEPVVASVMQDDEGMYVFTVYCRTADVRGKTRTLEAAMDAAEFLAERCETMCPGSYEGNEVVSHSGKRYHWRSLSEEMNANDRYRRPGESDPADPYEAYLNSPEGVAALKADRLIAEAKERA